MAILPTGTLDYTDKDFDSLKLRLLDLIKHAFPEWTSSQVGDFGVVLLEAFAFTGDVVVYYLDRQVRESRITQAQLRGSLIKLSRLINYELSGAVAATVDLTLTLQEALPATCTVPAGTVVRTLTENPIYFQTLADVVWTAGETGAKTVAAEHSTSYTEQFTSTTLPNQLFSLQYTPYLETPEGGTVNTVISTAEGTWDEQGTLLFSENTDRHCTIRVDEYDRAWIAFGDGVLGQVPSGAITVVYKTGGGTVGKVGAGTLTAIDETFRDANGTVANITVTNVASASGGVDRETVAAARRRAPASLRTLNRTVTRDDYENNALRNSSAARVLMHTSNQDSGIDENAGILYVVPAGGGTASSALLAAVETLVTVTYPNTLTFRLDVQSARYKTINVQATVFLHSGYTEAVVKAAVEAALATFFEITISSGDDEGDENPHVDFGGNFLDEDGNSAGEIALSDIYNAVRDVTGVRKMEPQPSGFLLNGSHEDVDLQNSEFPVLGTVILINGTTGLQM